MQGVGSATNGSGDSPRPISGEATEVDLSLPRAFQAAVEEGLLPKMPPEVLKHREAADRSDFQLWIFLLRRRHALFFEGKMLQFMPKENGGVKKQAYEDILKI